MSFALKVADLANNLAQGVQGLGASLGLFKPNPKFPEAPSQGIASDFQREHWYKTPAQGLYSFSVENVGKGSISEYPAFIDSVKSLFGDLGSETEFGEFKLPITPQEITQIEDFAVTVKPTQGGTVVNHSGNKYKTLIISGTTGVQPFRGLSGVYKGNGIVIGKPDELKYRSGYEVFQHFRQWVRSYHEKKTQLGSEPLRMLFRNYKDWEFLYVEPLKFNMRRDASKPLLYNYTIQFKVIGTHVIEKPLFDLAVAKLNDVAASVMNVYALVKKNKAITEYWIGGMDDYLQSVNSLKYALKAANQDEIKLSEFSKSDAEKLSFKETLKVLGQIGNAMGKESIDGSTAEDDPASKSFGLMALAQSPAATTAESAKEELNQLIDNEPELLAKIPVDELPPVIQQQMLEKQKAAAKVSALQVSALREQTISLSDKLADALGLGDETYLTTFGLTSTAEVSQSEMTDEQFEMLYALNEAEIALDGILSSDEMFDNNARLFQGVEAQNSANSVGQGIFSFPAEGGGVKEGYLPDGVTLEDLALSELGDVSRWTEIAELNNLKYPYIVSADDLLKPNFEVRATNYSNPSQIRDIQVGFYFFVPSTPTPGGGWSGKGNYIARYNGGDVATSASWTFFYPEDGTVIFDEDANQYFKYSGDDWSEVFPEDYNQDGVLKPGDKILIPSSAPAPIVTPLQGPRNNRFTNDLSNFEKSLAVDLRLNADLDLDLTPSGDLNVAYGVTNGIQAIVLKLLYEKGSLKEFPEIGTQLTPGKKIPDIATLRTDLVASLLQDTRIKDVTKISILQENNSVNLSFEVHFNDIQEPVTFNIPI